MSLMTEHELLDGAFDDMLNGAFTVVVTVPEDVLQAGQDPSDAVDPLLTAQFGWESFAVVSPRETYARDAYERATRKVADKHPGHDVTLEDADTGRVRLQSKSEAGDGEHIFLRVVRLFPKGHRMEPAQA